MICLKSFQEEISNITKFLGYKCDKKNILKKLKEEYREFKKAKPVNPGLILCAANIRDDKEFKYFFETRLKDTEADEIPDDIFIKCSYCEYMGYDLEAMLFVKKRWNSLKSKVLAESTGVFYPLQK